MTSASPSHRIDPRRRPRFASRLVVAVALAGIVSLPSAAFAVPAHPKGGGCTQRSCGSGFGSSTTMTATSSSR